MAIQKRQTKGGKPHYRIRVRAPEGTKHRDGRDKLWITETFERKTDAEAFEQDLASDKRHNRFRDPAAGRIALEPFTKAKYLPTKADVSTRTRENIVGRLRNHVFPALGNRRMEAFGYSVLLAWRAEQVGTRANDSINKDLMLLRQIFELAVRDNVVPRNPCDGIDSLPAQSRHEIHPATPEQIMRVGDAIDPRYRAAVIFAGLGTGLRAGELWALRVDRVNFLRRSVHVVESLSETNGGKLETNPPKNGKTRHVRLDPVTVEVLARHVEEYPSSGYLFTARNGGPVRHRNFMRTADRRGRGAGPWARAIAEVADLPEGFRFHDLRHSHASILIAHGWRPEQVKDRLGHGSIKTTVDLYSHLFPGHDDEQLADLAGIVHDALERDHSVTILDSDTKQGANSAP